MEVRYTADAMTGSLAAAAREIAKRELVNYILRTPTSERAMARAERVLPLGVASRFQFYEPHPLVIRSAAGARMEDVDGHQYVDFTLGYGSLFTGHAHPTLRRAVTGQLARGTLFVSPCEDKRGGCRNCSPPVSGCRSGGSRTLERKPPWTPYGWRAASPAGSAS